MTGYVDLQVNGYAGVDFNADQLSGDDTIAVCRRLRADGNESVLATIITAPFEKMITRIARIATLIEEIPEVASMIAGIHVEGPFLNPADGFIGAHPPASAIRATREVAGRLVDAGNGHVRMLTLAPEMDEGGCVTRWLDDQGVIVAAGHCDASIDQLQQGIDQGIRLFTHLGNGCPGSLPRHDNIIQRVLSLCDRLMVSLIADGHHVPPFALKNYLRVIPDENIVIVTDAISAAGLGPGRYELFNQIVEVDQDGAAWAECRTHFAGCAATFPQMIEVLRNQVGVSGASIQRWLCENPSRLIGSLTKISSK